jgi:hypothetical protein
VYDGHYKGWVQKRYKKKEFYNIVLSHVYSLYISHVPNKGCRSCTVCEFDGEIISFILLEKMYKKVRKENSTWTEWYINIVKSGETDFGSGQFIIVSWLKVGSCCRWVLTVERWDYIIIRHYCVVINNDKIWYLCYASKRESWFI